MQNTNQQYDQVRTSCQQLFQQKLQDYGAAWRILRPQSLTDQIYIKARRIRQLEELPAAKIDEGIDSEYIGIINYSIIAILQLELGYAEQVDIDKEQAMELYNKYFEQAKELMMRKNHDYGEAWRNMRCSSFTDLILMKILRTKQIEDNHGSTIVSEGIDANYFDMLNYSVFALIKLTLETTVATK